MKVQASIVTMALASVEAYYTHHFPATGHYLRVLGQRHSDDGIQPDDFAKFRDVLLETLEEFHGADWNRALEDDWRDALQLAISTMLEGDQQNYTW